MAGIINQGVLSEVMCGSWVIKQLALHQQKEFVAYDIDECINGNTRIAVKSQEWIKMDIFALRSVFAFLKGKEIRNVFGLQI